MRPSSFARDGSHRPRLGAIFPAWPWALRMHICGGFRVQVAGEPVAFRGRAQQRPLELLQRLVIHGGRDVYAGALADELWPDSDGDAAQHALESCLHRLRKLVGKDSLATRAGRISLDERRVWLDLWALERELDGLDADRGRGAAAGQLDLRRARIRALHRGPVFGEEGPIPAHGLRTRIETRVARALA